MGGPAEDARRDAVRHEVALIDGVQLVEQIPAAEHAAYYALLALRVGREAEFPAREHHARPAGITADVDVEELLVRLGHVEVADVRLDRMADLLEPEVLEVEHAV